MNLRVATPADASGICAITNPIIRNSLVTFTTRERRPEEVARDIDARPGRCLVAEVDGKISGFAGYGPFRAGPGYRHTVEHSIQLAPAARGAGTGRRLMERLQEIARQEGVHAMIAGVSGANPEGIAFHAALGFREVGRVPEVGRKFDRWLDLVLMQKILR